MPIQGLKFNIPTSSERHLSFQATGSFTAYNPNDGYTLIALDRTATLLDYDHKLPSQSGGHFPGPINSYLSMYFVDQSGAGLTGQIIVYASPDTLQIPQFWSIGRAIQSQVTSLDLIQGVQPPNPPANTTRLWSDASGHLHLAQSTGTDFTVLDTTNYGSIISLIGDVVGPVSNTIVNLRNAHWIQAYNASGVLGPLITTFSDNVTYIQSGSGGTGISLRNGVNSNLLTLDGSGNCIITGGLSTVGDIHGKDIYASRGDGTGVLYLAGGGNCYLFYNGAGYIFGSTGSYIDASSHPLQNVGQISGLAGMTLTQAGTGPYWGASGYMWTPTIYLGGNGVPPYIQNAGGAIRYWAIGVHSFEGNAGGSAYGNIQCYNLTVQGNSLSFSGAANITWNGTYLNNSHSIQFNTTGNQIVWPNGSYISGNAGYVQGSQESLKENVVDISDEDCLAQLLDPRMIVRSYNWPEDTRESMGFLAGDVAAVLPQYVIRDEKGEPAGYVPQELVALLWGAVRQLRKMIV